VEIDHGSRERRLARAQGRDELFGQQVIPPYAITATRATDPLDRTNDIVTFYVRNNGVGVTAGTRDVLAVAPDRPRRPCKAGFRRVG